MGPWELFWVHASRMPKRIAKLWERGIKRRESYPRPRLLHLQILPTLGPDASMVLKDWMRILRVWIRLLVGRVQSRSTITSKWLCRGNSQLNECKDWLCGQVKIQKSYKDWWTMLQRVPNSRVWLAWRHPKLRQIILNNSLDWTHNFSNRGYQRESTVAQSIPKT